MLKIIKPIIFYYKMSTICRLCLRNEEHIKKQNVFDLLLCDTLYWVFGVEVDTLDAYTKWICQKCLKNINFVLKLKKFFQMNQYFLKEKHCPLDFDIEDAELKIDVGTQTQQMYGNDRVNLSLETLVALNNPVVEMKKLEESEIYSTYNNYSCKRIQRRNGIRDDTNKRAMKKCQKKKRESSNVKDLKMNLNEDLFGRIAKEISMENFQMKPSYVKLTKLELKKDKQISNELKQILPHNTAKLLTSKSRRTGYFNKSVSNSYKNTLKNMFLYKNHTLGPQRKKRSKLIETEKETTTKDTQVFQSTDKELFISILKSSFKDTPSALKCVEESNDKVEVTEKDINGAQLLSEIQTGGEIKTVSATSISIKEK